MSRTFPYVTKDEAHEILAPHLPTIEEAIRQAWHDYGRCYANDAHRHSTRSRASLIHDHIISRLEEAIDGVSALRLTKIKGLHVLVVADRLLLRFKKLDRALRPSRPWTAQGEFHQQLPLLEDMPELVKLQAGYQLDRTNTSLQAILLTCPDGKAVRWHLELEQVAVVQIAPVEFDQAASESSGRVTIKDGAAKTRNSEANGAT